MTVADERSSTEAPAKRSAKAKTSIRKPPRDVKKAKHHQSSTLAELKREVLALARVSSTKELKRNNVDLRHLDFRLKISWSCALSVLQQAEAAYPDWNDKPPEEYRELFEAIDAASESYGRSIDQGFRLSEELERAADDMETISSELLEEAEELKKVHAAAARQAKARRQN